VKTIPLTQGKVALVDDSDYEFLSARKWYYKEGYAACNTPGTYNRKTIRMHRLLMSPGVGQQVDHINGDMLDNRRENLRICTPTQNAANKRLSISNKTGYKGIRKRQSGRWEARIDARSTLGYFDTAEEAALAYDARARERFGAFAALNFPGPGEQAAWRVVRT
jgi:HNH endonuclease